MDGVQNLTPLVHTEPLLVKPIFTSRHLSPAPDLVFTVMPLETQAAEQFYQEVIKPSVAALQLSCLRSDDLRGSEAVMEEIWQHLNRSRAVIAVLTGQNPNVFYEVGIAHTLGKPVLLLLEEGEKVPFDLAHLRVFAYPRAREGWANICSEIQTRLGRLVELQ